VSAKGDRGFVGQSEKNDDRVFVEESDLWKRAIAEKGAITFWERGNLVLLENGDRVLGEGRLRFGYEGRSVLERGAISSTLNVCLVLG
jgi:hypothetical protein